MPPSRRLPVASIAAAAIMSSAAFIGAAVAQTAPSQVPEAAPASASTAPSAGRETSAAAPAAPESSAPEAVVPVTTTQETATTEPTPATPPADSAATSPPASTVAPQAAPDTANTVAPTAEPPAQSEAKSEPVTGPAANGPAAIGTANEPQAETPAAVATAAPQAPPQLRVPLGTGAYAAAYEAAVLKPFTSATGIEASGPETTSGTGALDVVSVDAAALEQGCASGKLRDVSALEGLTIPAEDLVEATAKRCGVATLAWSSIFVFDRDGFKSRAPRSLKDVFNAKMFPGKRALPRDGRGVLEAALIAEGVAPAEVYSRLATDDGMRQALDEVASLGSSIAWYDNADDAIELLRSGTASIALTSNSRAFFDTARRGPLEFIWDGQVYDVDYLALPAKGGNPAAAERFVAFAAAPQQLAAIARQIPYGPMRRSALPLVGRHAATGEKLDPFLPTSDENLATAVRFDPTWWRDNAANVASALKDATMRTGGTPPPLPIRQSQR